MKFSIACSCDFYEKIDIRQFNNYEIIIKGEVLSVVENEADWEKQVKLKVKKIYKNIELPDTITVTTGLDGASCGLYFKKGENWLIYGYLQNGRYSTGLCTRSTKLNFIKNLSLFSEKRFLNRYKNYTGHIAKEYANGKMEDGKPVGEWIYKRKGKVWKTYRYSNDSILNGTCLVYREDGTIHYSMDYDNGQLSKTIYYDVDGKIERVYDK